MTPPTVPRKALVQEPALALLSPLFSGNSFTETVFMPDGLPLQVDRALFRAFAVV